MQTLRKESVFAPTNYTNDEEERMDTTWKIGCKLNRRYSRKDAN